MPQKFFYPTLINAKSALDEVGVLNQSDLANVTDVTFWVRFGAGTSAGTVLIESASDPNYTGTWAQEASVAWSVATKEHSVRVSGPNIALRARISVAIVGGSVDVKALGAKN